MDVNPTKSKALSKMRTQATDGDYRIHTPPRVLTLESAIEFIAADELVEVTPTAIRLRKRLLSQHTAGARPQQPSSRRRARRPSSMPRLDEACHDEGQRKHREQQLPRHLVALDESVVAIAEAVPTDRVAASRR
jgi:hypothetical protein